MITGLREAIALWRSERRLRWFFAAHAQGALGDGAGYVALLLLAYDRFGSAWAATLLTLADFAPGMLLGAALGALVDRRGRLESAIASDLIRATAFAGLVLVHGRGAMLALALLAGVGSALFRPATGALLPALTTDDRLGAANALQGIVREGGMLLGPAVAAGLLAVASPESVLALNAVTFAVSALLLTKLSGHIRPAAPAPAATETPTGFRAVLADPRARALIATSGAAVLAGGMLNVAELVFSQRDLAAGGSGYALLLGVFSAGLLAGSSLGAPGRDLLGVGLVAAGMLGASLAPGLIAAVLAFAVMGTGNGMFYVSNRATLQREVPEHLHGRAFGLLGTMDAWAVCAAVLLGGALVTALGARATFALAAGWLLVVALAARRALHPAGGEARAHGSVVDNVKVSVFE